LKPPRLSRHAALLLAAVIGSRGNMLHCAWCGELFIWAEQRKPQTGRKHYCPECRGGTDGYAQYHRAKRLSERKIAQQKLAKKVEMSSQADAETTTSV
jgi:hypothetical protein